MSTQSIYYLMVANFKDKKILCDFSINNEKKYRELTKNVIYNIQEKIKLSLIYDDKYAFYFQTYDGIIVFLITDKDYPSESGFECIKQTEISFKKKYNQERIDKAYKYSLNKDFLPILREKVKFFSLNQDMRFVSNISKLRDSVLETKDTLLETSEALDERGGKLNEIFIKANTLKDESQIYFVNSKRVKKTVKGYNYRIWICFALVLIGCYGLLTVLCGGSGMQNCLN